MDDSDDFAEDLFREVELEEKLMKEQEQREKFAQDRSFQFSATKNNSYFSNNVSRQSLTKNTNSTWTCSNCSFSNPMDTPFCKTCSRPRISGIQATSASSRLSLPSNHNWKETLQRSTNFPSTPHQLTLSDPILSSSPAHSQHSFTPTSPEAISSLGFPVLDPIASQTWIYPTNYPVREYQLDIVSKALFQNTLVSLPTGLGKTFIAAVVMFNFYRWFPAGKVIFMAPTRPLVTQQIGACNDIVGIPQNEVAELLGSKSVADRKRLWSSKRVFYCTPQILNNDLKNGVVNASLITCLVVDECHRAQGDYAYTTVLKQLLGVHHHFRVLGLSATPGTDIEKVQKVIQNLDINHICIRGRDDPDVKKYLKEVLEEEIVVKLNSKYQKVIEEWLALVNIPLNRLCNLGVLTERNAKKVHKMMLLDAQSRLIERRIPGISGQRWGEVMNDIGLLMSLTQATQILTQYGVGAFIETLASMKQETHTEKPNAAKNQFVTSSRFVEYYNRVFQGVRHHQYVHPKLEKLKQVLVDHFLRNASAGRETRVIVFAQFRSSVQEILNFLRGTDCIRATAFVGQQKKNNDVGILTEEGDFAPSAEKLYDIQPPTVQQPMISSYFARSGTSAAATPATSALSTSPVSSTAVSAATSGQTQKQQQQVLKDFKSGKFNVLVATCIAEEGLDIGEVDLLVCYEGVSSPTRLLQRKGRTGRKRAGRVFVLLTEGTEVQKHRSSIQKYNKVTNFLKTKSSSLQLCPQHDTLFTAAFHPQLVQERVSIQEYHYSQIGGHTPKKRPRGNSRPYEHTEAQKQKEKAFFESIRGEHIMELIQKTPSQAEFTDSILIADSQTDIQQEDLTFQAGHSIQTSFLLSMNQFISNREWQWKYPNEDTVQWIEEICSHPPKFPKLLPPTSLQGILSESSESESPQPLLDLSFYLNKEKPPEEKKEVEIMTLSSDDSDEDVIPPKEDAMIIETDSDSDVPIGSTLPVSTSVVKTTSDSDSDDISMFELLTAQKKSVSPGHKNEIEEVEKDEIEEVEKSEIEEVEKSEEEVEVRKDGREVKEDSDDMSMYELLTGARKEPPPANQPVPPLSTASHLTSDSDSDDDKPLGFFLEQAKQRNHSTVKEPLHNNPINETPSSLVPVEPAKAESMPQTNPSAIQMIEENTDLNLSSDSESDNKPITCHPVPPSEDKPEPDLLPKSNPSDKSISFDSTFPSKIASARSTLDSSSSSSLIIALLNSTGAHSQEHETIPDPVAVQPPPLSYSVIDSLFPRKSSISRETSLPSQTPRILCPLCLEECSSPEKLRTHINHDCRMLPHEVIPREEEELLTSLLDHTPADQPSLIQPQQSVTQPITHPSPSQPPADPSLGFNSEEIDRLLAVNISIPSPSSSACSICHDLSSTAPLLQCSHCGITVHAGCYGVQEMQVGWRCDSCQLGLYPVTCALCGKQGGGMKLSTDGLWAHVVCVTWNPSLIFVDNTILKPSNLRPILNESPKRVCCLCNRSVGITVKCYRTDCSRYFHVSCAQENGYDLDAVSEVDGVVFTIECKQHSKQAVHSDLISDNDLFNIADAMEEDGDI